MSNPFTRFLSSGVDDDPLVIFIGYWDRLEMLVVSIYRNDAAGIEDEREFEQVWAWLRKNYPGWQMKLGPYWRQLTTEGRPAQEDPFARLLAAKSAAEFAGDWISMQLLPVAREALNRYLVDQTSE